MTSIWNQLMRANFLSYVEEKIFKKIKIFYLFCFTISSVKMSDRHVYAFLSRVLQLFLWLQHD